MVEEVQSVHFTTRPVDGISCQGDSGGPALIERNGQWVLAGVLHAGDSECESNAHTTRIDPYLGWVERVLAEQIIDDSPPQLHGETASLQADGDLYYLAVDATDAGSGVASVSVIVDGQLIGMDDEAPFRVPVGRLKTGEHTFELRARDRAWNYGTGTVTVSTDGAEPLDSSDDNSMTGGCASSGGSAGEIGLMLIAVLAVLVRRRSSRLSWHATWRLLGPALILCVMPGKGQADSDRCRAAGGNWFDRPTPHCICPDGLGLSPTGSCTATSMTFRGVFVIAGENYLRPHLVRIDADGFATDLYEFDTCVAEIGTDSAREHIFVYHPGEGRILRLSRSGALETWAQDDRLVDTGDCNSSASTMGPDGTWYLRVDADDHYSRLVAIDTDSPAIEVLAGGYEYYGELRGDPIGGKTSYLALGPDGSLYSSGRCSPEGCPIVRRSPDGAFTDVGEPVDRVDAIAWTPDGLIVLETSDAVTRAVVVGDDNSRRSLQVDDRLSASRISVLSSGDLMTVSTGYVSSHRPPEAILRLSLTGHVSTVSMFQGQALWNVIGFAVLD